ncbi:hypothetical protein OOZ15_11635 [Galbibacter sp. EGI 63066]|uniref:hypothetical protein n=1 Tax=Galbibacter sp. EGI 63066 TaxID=2993559 RepID=UPI002248ADC2|nr:hypothetical protein [Galbibacter sp. EGI 63066]MCX2680594.1 hypothetical protein [Galbibacter sp. EGI 63066]
MITVIEKNADISYFYNVAEEEKKDTSTEYKDIKELPYPKDASFSLSDILNEKEEAHYYIQYNYDQYIDVVIPPPEYRI